MFNREKILKTFGKNHMAPDEYNYVLKLESGNLLINCFNYEKHTFIGNVRNTKGLPYISSGYNKVNDVDMWVINQEKQGYYYLWFKSRKEAVDLEDYLIEKMKSQETKQPNSIYRLGKNGWNHCSDYATRKKEDLIGHDGVLETVIHDISNYTRYLDFLKTIGEESRTLNYLLYGPPGTGKSSMIKTLGTMLKLPIFIINQNVMEHADASVLLNPTSAHQHRIVLFEDLDRYLKEGKYCMSDILNQLDGVESSKGCIRFFTCNDINEIYKHDALLNRMSAKFEFGYPTIEDFEKKLDRLLTFWYDDWRNDNIHERKKFLSIIEERLKSVSGKITLRPFTTFVIRYLFENDCFEKMIENVGELYK